MKKFITLCLAVAPLLGAQLYAEAPMQSSQLADNEPKFQNILGFISDDSYKISTHKVRRKIALNHAATVYGQSLIYGRHVPDDAMRVMRTARDDIMFSEEWSERRHIVHHIINYMKIRGESFINLPNAIPPFLLSSVTDKTPLVYDMIDAMGLNPPYCRACETQDWSLL